MTFPVLIRYGLMRSRAGAGRGEVRVRLGPILRGCGPTGSLHRRFMRCCQGNVGGERDRERLRLVVRGRRLSAAMARETSAVNREDSISNVTSHVHDPSHTTDSQYRDSLMDTRSSAARWCNTYRLISDMYTRTDTYSYSRGRNVSCRYRPHAHTAHPDPPPKRLYTATNSTPRLGSYREH